MPLLGEFPFSELDNCGKNAPLTGSCSIVFEGRIGIAAADAAAIGLDGAV